MTKQLLLSAVAAAGLLAATPASATLSVRANFANAALSIDGFATGNPDNSLTAIVPVGATVLAAYLYSADVFGNSPAGGFTFEGNAFTWSAGSLLVPNANPANTRFFDVTTAVQTKVSAENDGSTDFSIAEDAFLDGEVLVVVYRTITTIGNAIILDGELAPSGDSVSLTLAAPYVSGNLIASLASSFSFNGSGTTNTTGQVTIVDVTTNTSPIRRLTSCAGGNDDGDFVGANGSLITAGGVGDSIANPDPNCGGGAGDDELYNLAAGNSANAAPFLSVGDTLLNFATSNPTGDDNVFALFFSTDFAIRDVDPDPTPEPATLALLGLGLGGLALARRRRA